MNDERVQNKIEQLVGEEHELLGLDPAARPADHHQRLTVIEAELDRCWDLLRQRRARRSAGAAPDEVSVRPAVVVEGYRQ